MSARRLALSALIAVAGCSPGFPSGEDITAAVESMPKLRSVAIAPINGSGIIGSVLISGYDRPSAQILGGVAFPNLGPQAAGARYPMHVHRGGACDGVGLIAHDLGTPTSIVEVENNYPSVRIPETTLSGEHLRSGYSFDVHAPGDPNGAPLGCAVF